jgi:hypothetical protein
MDVVIIPSISLPVYLRSTFAVDSVACMIVSRLSEAFRRIWQLTVSPCYHAMRCKHAAQYSNNLSLIMMGVVFFVDDLGGTLC